MVGEEGDVLQMWLFSFLTACDNWLGVGIIDGHGIVVKCDYAIGVADFTKDH